MISRTIFEIYSQQYIKIPPLNFTATEPYVLKFYWILLWRAIEFNLLSNRAGAIFMNSYQA